MNVSLKQYAAAMVSLSALLAVMLTGCAKEEFVRQRFSASGAAAGFRFLPAKVDIVMVPDNTGSITQGYSTVTSQLSSFVSTLQGQDWDYHLMRTLISNPGPIDRALVNSNYNGPYLPDGLPNLNTDWVPSQYAVTDAGQFPLLNNSDLNPGAGSIDSTVSVAFNQMQQAIGNSGAHFIRNDALLAIIVITNGVDANLLNNSSDAFSGTNNSAVATWANNFKGLKPGTGDSLVRFYAISSPTYRSSGCYGGSAFSGDGYFSFVNGGHLKGLTRDFCDPGSISGVLGSIAADLQAVKQSFVYGNIVLPFRIVPSSLRVFKNGQQLANSATNGFTFSDSVQTVPTVVGIREPNGTIKVLNAHYSTGYVISLHGGAQMNGSDQPSLDYERL